MLNILFFTHAFLLASQHPSFPGAWKSMWGTDTGAGPVCNQIHSLPPPLLCSGSPRQVTSGGSILKFPVSSSFLQSSPNGRGWLVFWKQRGREKPSYTPSPSFCLGWSVGIASHVGLPSSQPPEMTLPLGSSKTTSSLCPSSLGMAEASICCWPFEQHHQPFNILTMTHNMWLTVFKSWLFLLENSMSIQIRNEPVTTSHTCTPVSLFSHEPSGSASQTSQSSDQCFQNIHGSHKRAVSTITSQCLLLSSHCLASEVCSPQIATSPLPRKAWYLTSS